MRTHTSIFKVLMPDAEVLWLRFTGSWVLPHSFSHRSNQEKMYNNFINRFLRNALWLSRQTSIGHSCCPYFPLYLLLCESNCFVSDLLLWNWMFVVSSVFMHAINVSALHVARHNARPKLNEWILMGLMKTLKLTKADLTWIWQVANESGALLAKLLCFPPEQERRKANAVNRPCQNQRIIISSNQNGKMYILISCAKLSLAFSSLKKSYQSLWK